MRVFEFVVFVADVVVVAVDEETVFVALLFELFALVVLLLLLLFWLKLVILLAIVVNNAALIDIADSAEAAILALACAFVVAVAVLLFIEFDEDDFDDDVIDVCDCVLFCVENIGVFVITLGVVIVFVVDVVNAVTIGCVYKLLLLIEDDDVVVVDVNEDTKLLIFDIELFVWSIYIKYRINISACELINKEINKIFITKRWWGRVKWKWTLSKK